MTNPQQFSLVLLCILFAQSAWAGRPIGTDDAGTADAGTCQIEGWQERLRSARALIIAPACGIASGLELGIDYTRLPGDTARGAGVALKSLPQSASEHSWAGDTPVGENTAGLKLSSGYQRHAGESWRHRDSNVLLLVSTKFNDMLTLHTNIGGIRSQAEKPNAALFNIALAAKPSERVLLFVESQTNHRRTVFGPTVNTIGGSWWTVKQRFGLDTTASRPAGSHAAGTTYGIGFGWVGLAL